MLLYIDLFLVFVYFKLARVHKKEEKVTNIVKTSHLIVALVTIKLYVEAILKYNFLEVAGISFLFFIIAALMITAVQVGIFIEGKPLIGIGKLYKTIPYLAGAIAVVAIFA